MQRMRTVLFLSLLCSTIQAGCFDRPVQILRPDSSHSQLIVQEEGLQQLLDCLEQNIALVGVVGPYHSGKSFLLNQLAGRNAFKVGPTVEPETLGIWLLPTEDRSPADGSQIVLMDTEGFFGTDVAETYDANIFAITALLSSHLVYNSIKLVDQSAVDYLELLAQRTRLFSLRSLLVEQENGLALASRFPPLTWVVEDFTQDLAGSTPDEWLQRFVDSKRDANQPDGLSSVFEELACETLFLPATSLAELQDLSRVGDDSLTREFKRDLADLKATLYKKLTAKQMFGSSMGPGQLASSLRFLAESSNRRKFPELPNYWDSWVKNLTEHAKIDAGLRLRQLLSSKLSAVDDLASDGEFEAICKTAFLEVEEYFRHLVFDIESFYASPETKLSLTANLMSIESEYADRNRQRLSQFILMIKAVCQRALDAEIVELNRGNPQPSAPLAAVCAGKASAQVNEFKNRAGRFNDTAKFKDELRYFEEAAMYGCERVSDDNSNALKQAMNSVMIATKNALKSWIDSAAQNTPMMSESEIAALESSSFATDQLRSQIDHSPLVWITEDQMDSELYLAKASSDIRVVFMAAFAKLRQSNEERIWSEVLRQGSRELEALRAETRRTLPQSQRAIGEQLKQRQTAFSAYLEKLYFAFGESEFRKNKLASWTERSISDTMQELVAENTRIYERMFGEATRQCRRKALESLETECPSCKWLQPWNNRFKFNSANMICLRQVELKENIKIPSEVAAEMIDIWSERELDRSPVAIWTGGLIVLTAALAIAVFKK